jgi:hypothetical protein
VREIRIRELKTLVSVVVLDLGNCSREGGVSTEDRGWQILHDLGSYVLFVVQLEYIMSKAFVNVNILSFGMFRWRGEGAGAG